MLDAVHHATTADFAPIRRGIPALHRRPGPRLQLGLQVYREWENALRREYGRRAKGGRGLLLALGAVAVVYGKWLGLRRVEIDVAALAGHAHCRGAALCQTANHQVFQVAGWVCRELTGFSARDALKNRSFLYDFSVVGLTSVDCSRTTFADTRPRVDT